MKLKVFQRVFVVYNVLVFKKFHDQISAEHQFGK